MYAPAAPQAWKLTFRGRAATTGFVCEAARVSSGWGRVVGGQADSRSKPRHGGSHHKHLVLCSNTNAGRARTRSSLLDSNRQEGRGQSGVIRGRPATDKGVSTESSQASIERPASFDCPSSCMSRSTRQNSDGCCPRSRFTTTMGARSIDGSIQFNALLLVGCGFERLGKTDRGIIESTQRWRPSSAIQHTTPSPMQCASKLQSLLPARPGFFSASALKGDWIVERAREPLLASSNPIVWAATGRRMIVAIPRAVQLGPKGLCDEQQFQQAGSKGGLPEQEDFDSQQSASNVSSAPHISHHQIHPHLLLTCTSQAAR